MVYGTNAPWGLKVVGRQDGSPYTGAFRHYPVASAYATSLFKGDPIMFLADGTVGIGTAGNICCGIFDGIEYQDTAGVWQFRPMWTGATATLGSVAAKARVIDDPNVVMSVQEAATNTAVGTGTAGTQLVDADIGNTVNFKAPTTGVVATGQSAFFLDNASETTTATLNFFLMGPDPHPENVASGTSYRNWLVTWARHQYRSLSAGV